jgi:hypothetical protein
MAKLLTTTKDVSEKTQMSSFQNGTLQTAIDGVAMTIETHFDIPATCKTQDDVHKHMTGILSAIQGKGVSFTVTMGEAF